MQDQELTDTYMRLRVRLKNLASSILSNEEDADDALQEAFCRLWAKRGEYDAAYAEGSAVVAVKRMCLSFLRKRASAKDDSIERAVENAENRQVPPIWESDEAEMLLKRMMAKLSENQRVVFEMVSRGIDYDIISMRLGMPEATVRQHLCRARKILKDEYWRLQKI